MRQVVLDTETTGISPEKGHRIIEVGCIELINRSLTGNHFHHYVNPEREIDEGAQRVHGITLDFLQDKPLFAEIAGDLFDFLDGAELIIHNAPFDLKFLDSEYNFLKQYAKPFRENFSVVDTLKLARTMYPGQRNNLDALCKRLEVDNSSRDLHGALLDSEILAEVYLKLTYGQTNIKFKDKKDPKTVVNNKQGFSFTPVSIDTQALKLASVSDEENSSHTKKLASITEASDKCIWQE